MPTKILFEASSLWLSLLSWETSNVYAEHGTSIENAPDLTQGRYFYTFIAEMRLSLSK